MAEPETSEPNRRRILVVEDDFLIASEMVGWLEAANLEVIGPAASLQQALALVEMHGPHLDGAVLDIHIRDGCVYPIADKLNSTGVPYIFTTGYDSAAIPAAYTGAPRCEKPVNRTELIEMLDRL